MAFQMIFQDCPKGLKDQIAEYWDRKQTRIDRLLQPIPADQQHLRVTVSRENGRFGARAVLALPTGTLVTDQAGETYREAIDKAVDCLTGEIRKHKQLFRRDERYRRQTRRQTDWAAVGRHLAEQHGRRQQEVFFELLRPALRDLKDHARRELVLAQIEGALPIGEVTVADLVHDVMVLAWERFASRPDDRPLAGWLIELFHEALDAHSHLDESIGLEQRVPAGDARYEAQDGWAEENDPCWEATEPVRYEDVLPAGDIPEPLEEAEAHDQQRWILAQLGALPRHQRRAFTLHVLDGWEPDEIAMVQRRTTDEVRADIEAARDLLRQCLRDQR